MLCVSPFIVLFCFPRLVFPLVAVQIDRPVASSCGQCKYLATELSETEFTGLALTTPSGFGRTGNFLIGVLHAIHRAHQCKTSLLLPATDPDDRLLGAFDLQHYAHRLDFSSRPGEAHPDCNDSSYGIGYSGDLSWFANYEGVGHDDGVRPPRLRNTTAEHAKFFEEYVPDTPQFVACLKHYLGLCSGDYCTSGRYREDSLVAHIRGGDLFPANHSRAPPNYEQPVEAFYLRAFTFKPWREILVLTEPNTGTYNPVYKHLEVLKATGFARIPITIQAGNWSEDIRTLLCAKNVAVSRSSLSRFIIELGGGDTYFSQHCQKTRDGAVVYKIHNPEADETERMFEMHTNSPQEWLAMLLTEVDPPVMCNLTDGVSILKPYGED